MAVQENLTVHGMTHDGLEDHLRAELADRQLDTLPRWHEKLCVDIHGVQDQYSTMLFDHLKAVGSVLGLSIRRDCGDPRLFIFLTDQSDALASDIVRRNPRLFLGFDGNPEYQDNKFYVTPEEVANFLRPRAVRWLSSSASRSSGDMPPLVLSGRNGPFYASQSYEASMLEETSRRDLTIMLIIVDINRVHDESWGMLGDLLSVIGFAAPHLSDSYDTSSILHVTKSDRLEGPTGAMTAYDRALLSSLYALPEGYSQSDAIDWMSGHFTTDARSH
ncbi:hypothetical protein AA0535_2811 [Asaia krungthepensis NRIC 0535]|uniref:Uncharacterized protein n=1 Tax=Asaia krungthepensis NRIC 0535 TaxID=1307925 RepID=A0ABQ0Q6A0_9PROT|nr:hypothetical protein AA0535_2811 [Asaia krungthepensis NRIC 0535]